MNVPNPYHQHRCLKQTTILLTKLIVVDTVILRDILTLQPRKSIEQGNNDDSSEHQQPGQRQQVRDAHELERKSKYINVIFI